MLRRSTSHYSRLSPHTVCRLTGNLTWLGEHVLIPQPCSHLRRHQGCLLQGKVTVGSSSFVLLCLWSSSWRRRREVLLSGCCLLAPARHRLGCVWSTGALGQSGAVPCVCCSAVDRCFMTSQSQTCKSLPFAWVKLSFPQIM